MTSVLKPRFFTIKDPSDPRLGAYSCLKGKSLEKEGIFIAEGEKVVGSMLECGLPAESCLVSGTARGRYGKLVSMMAERGARVYIASDDIIEAIIGFRFHRGIMAVGRCPKRQDLSGVLGRPGKPVLVVALNGVNDPQNVGLIARNAAAFGVNAMIIDSATYDPYYRKAVRVSMGAIFRLPVVYSDDLAACLNRLRKEYGTRPIAATPHSRSADVSDSDLSGSLCMVFGNEDKGVSRGILDIADGRIRINISGKIDSLNVASASAVCLYEASRRRRKKTGGRQEI